MNESLKEWETQIDIVPGKYDWSKTRLRVNNTNKIVIKVNKVLKKENIKIFSGEEECDCLM